MKRWLLIAAMLACSVGTASAQGVPQTANLTAQDSGPCTTPNACLTTNIPTNYASGVIQLSGTWSGTVQFEAATDKNGAFTAISGTPIGSSSAVTSATANGAWRFNVASIYYLRARVSTYSSGTISAAITASPVSAYCCGGGGAGGSGVSSFSGDTTLLSNSGSTGAVTATLANAAQNSLFSGPVSGGAGSPSYKTIATFYGSWYSGTPNQQFTSCEAAARAASGICDMSGLDGTVVFPSATGLTIGDSTGDPVTIIWPGNGTVWQFPNLSGSCMLTQYMGTTGFGIGVSQDAFTMENTSTAGGALCGFQVLNGTAANGYWREDGIYFQQHGGGVSSGIFVNIGAGEDNSGLYHFAVFDSSTTDTNIVALTATGSTAGFCCGASLSDGLIDGNSVGGIPLAIYGITGGKQPNGFNIHNVQMNHPANGLENFFCQDTSSQPKVDVTFSGAVYVEANGDTTTPIFENDGCRRISMAVGTVIHAEANATAKTVFTSTNRFATLWDIGPVSLISGNGNWTLPATIINDSATNYVGVSDSNGFFSGYNNGPDYRTNLTLGGTGGANLYFQTTTPAVSVQLHGFDSNSGAGAPDLDVVFSNLTNQAATFRLFRQVNTGTANACAQIFNGDSTSGLNTAFCGLIGNSFVNANNTTGSFSVGRTSCGGLFQTCGGTGATPPWGFSSTGNLTVNSCTGCGSGIGYPGAGVARSSGSAWLTSYTVGTAASNLVQLNGSAQLPAVSAANLTNFPTLNQNTTGTAANLSGTPTVPNGTAAATQSLGDTSTKIATDAFVLANASGILVAAHVDLTGQNGNIGTTTLLSPIANGYYRATGWAVSTNTPTGATVPGVVIHFTDADSSVAQTPTLLYSFPAASAAGDFDVVNHATSPGDPVWSGTFYAKSGVAIGYSTTGYAAGSGTALVYALHLRLEGPF